MSSPSIFQEQSELSLAAYAEGLFAEISAGEYRLALVAGGTGMSPAQADRFAALWKVVDQFSDLATGASATIFQNGTHISLAIRGSQLESGDLLADGLIALGVSASLNPQFAALQVQLDKWLGTTGPLHDKQFAVAGHSLGGYLAAALKAAYPSSVTTAYLYNAPGSGGLVGNVADVVSGVFSQSTPGANGVWNIKASEGDRKSVV